MAKPKLALIPAAQGTKLYSVLPSDGVGDFDFTRGSVATRINAQGLIENVASGQSRLDYPLIGGVQKGCPHHILEPARTNVVTYSEDFGNASWIKQSGIVSDNQTISPNGELNADKLIDGATNGILRKQGISLLASDYTFSVFAKKDDRDYLLLITSFGEGTFDLLNGVVVSSTLSSIGNIEEYKNGWYKCSLTFTATASSPFFRISTGGSQSVIIGVSGIYIWGAMLEQGSFISSYIPTTSTAVTRSAETANGAGNSTTFSDSEGVLMAEISALANDGVSKRVSISDGGYSNRVVLDFSSVTNTINCFVISGGVIQYNPSEVLSDITLNNKIGLKYKENNFSLFINGFEFDIDTNGIPPSGLNTLQFAEGDGGASPFYGNTKQLQYFDSALADTQLEQLTSWQSFRDMANGQLYTIE